MLSHGYYFNEVVDNGMSVVAVDKENGKVVGVFTCIDSNFFLNPSICAGLS